MANGTIQSHVDNHDNCYLSTRSDPQRLSCFRECPNPAGRKLGVATQVGGGAEMLLWGKVPGDSDGDCGIGAGIPAGQFSPVLAMRLINGT